MDSYSLLNDIGVVFTEEAGWNCYRIRGKRFKDISGFAEMQAFSSIFFVTTLIFV
jgi:hypothetical protein